MYFLKKYKKIISIILSFIGLLFAFVGGVFSSKTNFEKISNYATQVVKENTNSKKLCALTVEKTNESGSIIDSDSEFHRLYGIFKQQKITFASTINADKRHEIRIANDVSENLSMLYAGPVGSIPYNGHFKHYTLPIEIMFEDEKMYDISKNVAYISQTHANRLLKKQNILPQPDGEFLSTEYKSLLKQLIVIFVDGVETSFVIQNIYCESNYYFDGLHEVMGDFIMISYWAPGDLQSERQNMYFMSDYAYQNEYFMNHINEIYSSKKYLLKVNRFNIVGEIDESYLTSFYYSNDRNNDWIFALLLTLSVTFLGLSLLLCLLNIKAENESAALMFFRFLLLLTPYLIFLIIYKFSKNISYFSSVSTKANLWLIISYIVLYSLITIFVKTKNRNALLIAGEAYYEISL